MQKLPIFYGEGYLLLDLVVPSEVVVVVIVVVFVNFSIFVGVFFVKYV